MTARALCAAGSTCCGHASEQEADDARPISELWISSDAGWYKLPLLRVESSPRPPTSSFLVTLCRQLLVVRAYGFRRACARPSTARWLPAPLTTAAQQTPAGIYALQWVDLSIGMLELSRGSIASATMNSEDAHEMRAAITPEQRDAHSRHSRRGRVTPRAGSTSRRQESRSSSLRHRTHIGSAGSNTRSACASAAP